MTPKEYYLREFNNCAMRMEMNHQHAVNRIRQGHPLSAKFYQRQAAIWYSRMASCAALYNYGDRKYLHE